MPYILSFRNCLGSIHLLNKYIKINQLIVWAIKRLNMLPLFLPFPTSDKMILSKVIQDSYKCFEFNIHSKTICSPLWLCRSKYEQVSGLKSACPVPDWAGPKEIFYEAGPMFIFLTWPAVLRNERPWKYFLSLFFCLPFASDFSLFDRFLLSIVLVLKLFTWNILYLNKLQIFLKQKI